MVGLALAWPLLLAVLSATERAPLALASTCPSSEGLYTTPGVGGAWSPALSRADAFSEGQSAAQEEKQQAAATMFFRQIDGDGDGQIEAEEARSYVAGLSGEEFDTSEEVSRAVQDMMGDLDGSDTDASISLAEFMAHSQAMLQGSRVSDWVQHGLELPQYAAHFRENAITIGDFPLLAGSSGDAILREDLKVASRLHRDRIVRSIKQQMLGLGRAPSPPQGVQCESVKCRIIVNWRPPSNLGGPSFHKYVIEQRIMNVEGWTVVGETDADDNQLVLGGALQGGKYEFRVTAWNSAGRSPHGVSDACVLSEMQCSSGLTRDGHMSSAVNEAALMYANSSSSNSGESGSTVSFWVWINSGISAAAYVAVILIKHTAQDPSFRGRLKLRIAEFAPVRLIALFANRSRQLEEWAQPTSRRAFAKLDHSDSTLNTQLAHANAGSTISSEQCDASFESAMGEDFPYGVDEAPSPEVIHGLTQGLYPKGFPVELVATPMPARALPFSSPISKSAGNLLGMTQTDSAQAQQHGIQIDYENTARRGSSGSRMSERDLDNSENGSGRKMSAGSRYRCAHPGCKRAWEKWHSLKDLRRMAHSHYCGSCQQSYCGHHTRISPHGPTGSCGMDSECMCIRCYGRLSPEEQEIVGSRNRLKVRPPLSSHGTGTSCGGSEASGTMRAGMDDKIADLDCHLSQIRGEANWAKARSKMKVVGKLLSSGRKMPASSLSRHGLPPTAPAPGSPQGHASVPASHSVGAGVRKLFGREYSPLKRNSLNSADQTYK